MVVLEGHFDTLSSIRPLIKSMQGLSLFVPPGALESPTGSPRPGLGRMALEDEDDDSPQRTRRKLSSVSSFDVSPSPGLGSRLPGLPNLGNTCFMNAVLQCLFNVKDSFIDLLQKMANLAGPQAASSSILNRHSNLVISFLNLASKYLGQSGGALTDVSALMSFKAAIAELDPTYSGCHPQDAYEFLGSLLDHLDTGLSALLAHAGRGNIKVIVKTVFGVTTYARRECHRCRTLKKADKAVDTALRLPLVSPEARRLEALLRLEERTKSSLFERIDAAQQPERIEGYDCDSCQALAKQRGEAHRLSMMTQQASMIEKTSELLIIVLCRFLNVTDRDGNFVAAKVSRMVDFPTLLSLGSGDYELRGVVSHLGTHLENGHYVATVRSPRDNVWYDCDDSEVKPSVSRALYIQGEELAATRAGADPFILFYRRI